jgi:hypothetical protein
MANAGTLGSAYDIDIASSVGGNYTKADGSSSNGLSKTSVQFGLDSFLKIGNTYTASDEYTLYTVISFNAAYGSPIKPLYGSDSGETVGLSIVDSTSATPMKYQTKVNTIGVRHENKLSTPAAAGTNNTSQNTIDYRFPVTDSDQDDYQKIYILLIRRNSNGDIIAYNYLGERIAFIQGTDKTDPSSKLGTLPGDTNGDLVIDQIGSAGSNVDDSFKGRVARFGVINRDVGDEVTRNLAKQLFNLYKF